MKFHFVPWMLQNLEVNEWSWRCGDLSALLVEGSASKFEMAGIMRALKKGTHWFTGHILVLNHFPIGPVIKSETTTLWQLAEDSLTDLIISAFATLIDLFIYLFI